MKNERVIILQFPLWYNNSNLSYRGKDTAKSFFISNIISSKVHKQHILFYSFLFDS